jgi:hypothetical protein
MRTIRPESVQLSYPYQCAEPVVSPRTAGQISLESARIVNNTSSTMSLGLVKRFADGDYTVIQVQASETDITDSLDAGSATSIFSTTNDHGILVQSRKRFNVIGFNIAQETTGSPVYTVKYYNGTSFVDLATEIAPSYSSTGRSIVSFLAPFDWAVGAGSYSLGESDLYSVEILATTAPTQEATADTVWVGQFLTYAPEVVTKGQLNVSNDLPYDLFEAGESVVPYFGTANASNFVELSYASQK